MSALAHQFNVGVACETDVMSATMFNLIGFWVDTNRANGRHGHDGRHWTRNTIEAWCEYMPYATPRQIERALKELRDKGFVDAMNYNDDRRDRTLWYTLTDKGWSYFSGSEWLPEPTVDRTPRGGTQDQFDDLIDEVIDYVNQVTGKRYRKGTKKYRDGIRARIREGATREQLLAVVDDRQAKWGNDPRMRECVNPETLFRPSNFDRYLNATRVGREAGDDFADF